MTTEEAEKIAKLFDHREITARVVADDLGAKVVLLADRGPQADMIRLTLEDVGWEGKKTAS